MRGCFREMRWDVLGGCCCGVWHAPATAVVAEEERRAPTATTPEDIILSAHGFLRPYLSCPEHLGSSVLLLVTIMKIDMMMVTM